MGTPATVAATAGTRCQPDARTPGRPGVFDIT
jgi:hypothetical protein